MKRRLRGCERERGCELERAPEGVECATGVCGALGRERPVDDDRPPRCGDRARGAAAGGWAVLGRLRPVDDERLPPRCGDVGAQRGAPLAGEVALFFARAFGGDSACLPCLD